jgi:nucleotide-binding universal stress UspA family protein
VDLLYAGAAPHEPVLRDILGSTARRIARRARCSVLLDSEPRGRDGRFPTAVVSVRMDAASRRMVGFGVGLAKAGMIDRLHIVREIEPVPPSVLRGSTAVTSQIIRARSDAELREFVSAAAEAGVPLKTLCVEGRDQSGVISYSETVGADLVICQGPARRIRTLGRLLGHEHEALLTDLPSALLLMQARTARSGKTDCETA